MTIRSARQIRATVRAVEPSIFVLAMTACKVSKVNQATFRSFSIAAWAEPSVRCDFPVPDGPAITIFSALPIHSRVINEFCVASVMDECSGRQDARVLPVGKFTVERRSRRVAAFRPTTSSDISTRSTSAGSQR